MRHLASLILVGILAFSFSARSEFEWVSYTLDNDLFLGTDNGYTNGLYVALYDIEGEGSQPTPSWMLEPLHWSFSKGNSVVNINTYTIGQTMVTPQDITIAVPNEDDLPYAGMLYVNNTFLAINEQYTDKISATLGVVGPLSLAEQSQKLIHKMIGADEPLGWDTQLGNELVFQLERGRAWRAWVSDNQNWDLVTTAELSAGTLSSEAKVGGMVRYGTRLVESYATTLFINSRTTNPVAIEGNWNLYAGVSGGYLFNQIFTDGNTFRASRSTDYDHEFIAVAIGFTYSWDGYSIAFALYDSNITFDDSEEQVEDLTRFGTLTFAVQL